jgi:hypothetical protein
VSLFPRAGDICKPQKRISEFAKPILKRSIDLAEDAPQNPGFASIVARRILVAEGIGLQDWRNVLGKLIAQLDQSDVASGVLATLDPRIAGQLERRAAAASMTVADFAAGAVREFVEHADDDLRFQLLTIVRKSDDPSLTAVQTILTWVVTER